MKTDFNTKLSGLLRLLLPLSTSERVMDMLYDDSVSAEKVKEYVVKGQGLKVKEQDGQPA